MLVNGGGGDLQRQQQQKSFRIKHDDRFFSRLLSKENSVKNPSFRDYYGDVAGAVPFTWETCPGTPKHQLCHSSTPPLTPPPSYLSGQPSSLPSARPRSGSKLLRTLLTLRINHRRESAGAKRSVLPSSPSVSSSSFSSSSWSSSRSSVSMPGTLSRLRFRSRTSISPRSSFDYDGEDVGDRKRPAVAGSVGSPKSIIRLGIINRNSCSWNCGFQGILMLKRTLLSIVGRGSG